MGALGGITIGPFRGDYEGLERMAHASWRDEYGAASFPNFYRPAFLHYLFDRIPEDRRDLLLGAYKDNEIVGFLANLPQKFHFEGKILSGVYSCLLVVRKEHLRKGVALDIIRAAVGLNKRYGFDFSLLTLETGHRSTRMMAKLRAEGTGSSRSASPGSWPASSTSTASMPRKVSRAAKRRLSGFSALTVRPRPRRASS
jgi:GNAT superfamily N-acetyltransferase